ncbi:uncharacterized protein LOC125424078 [Ziziphus jujuba]|uniref:Uncharacterized protein LOC125424078 n=1 Tax=Ziziphus jujuba TaxID=326968 RepID=A0ABM3IVU5_ZIZJJ|nr:uncharacterized protein LOC125424078 [Ziziphus jujuba]
MTKLCKHLEFSNSVIVEANGLVGGLTFMWKKEINFELEWSSEQIINGIIKEEDGKEGWRLIAYHGTPYRKEKEAFWNHLENTILECEMPWVVIGDLNDIFEELEKFEGRKKVGAVDLSFSGKRFTWENKQEGRAYIKERLDRDLASQDWISLFSDATIHHLPMEQSDHAPILLCTHEEELSYGCPFRFLKAWMNDNSYFETEKIKAFEKELEESQFGNLEDRMKHARIEKELGEQRARLECIW